MDCILGRRLLGSVMSSIGAREEEATVDGLLWQQRCCIVYTMYETRNLKRGNDAQAARLSESTLGYSVMRSLDTKPRCGRAAVTSILAHRRRLGSNQIQRVVHMGTPVLRRANHPLPSIISAVR